MAGISIRLLTEKKEIREALAFGWKMFRDKEILRQRDAGVGNLLRVFQMGLPRSYVIGGRKDGQLCAVAALIGDSTAGLPLEESKGGREMISSLRGDGERVGEIFAVTVGAGGTTALKAVLSFGLVLAGLEGMTRLVGVVSPRHARFYARMKGISVLGEVEGYWKFAGRYVVVVVDVPVLLEEAVSGTGGRVEALLRVDEALRAHVEKELVRCSMSRDIRVLGEMFVPAEAEGAVKVFCREWAFRLRSCLQVMEEASCPR